MSPLWRWGTAVSLSNFDSQYIYWSNTQNVQDGGWNVVGKQLSSPKMFNSWAVIDFVADKLDINQIRGRVRALSSCCLQLGKFLWMHWKLFFADLGMRMIIQVWSIYIYFLFPQVSSIPPLAIERGNLQHPEEVWVFLHFSIPFFSTLSLRVLCDSLGAFKTERSLSLLYSS